MNALLKYHSERIIVKEPMCNPCPRTVVTHMSGLYTWLEGKDLDESAHIFSFLLPHHNLNLVGSPIAENWQGCTFHRHPIHGDGANAL